MNAWDPSAVVRRVPGLEYVAWVFVGGRPPVPAGDQPEHRCDQPVVRAGEKAEPQHQPAIAATFVDDPAWLRSRV